MNSEHLTGFGSIDPDELAVVVAVVVCASVRLAGKVPRVVIQTSLGAMMAIQVWESDRLIASFPTHPIPVDAVQFKTLAGGIEIAGHAVMMQLQKAIGR